ncbi:dihydrodipicolinate synthase family protein [Paenibacillus dendritiformis]|uniref:dihydrodipicolinate synthase family protein n=1 Tax=Paenibacillus dendritiformis TaxID=130049 RepID=UPI001F556BB7|nr:dihydrodipicolinate synthase family protein [Paenibacillus dendritiformis]
MLYILDYIHAARSMFMHRSSLTWRNGADAALIVTPYYNRPSQQGIIQHFQALAGAELPVILYEIPYRTGAQLELET